MTEAIEEAVAPLDAYATAKPDEPVFTLQGGDPLAAPLVRLWAFFARRRAMAVRIEQETFGELIEAAIGHTVEHDDREKQSLLVRATAAEEVSWAMDAYAKGQVDADKPSEAADTHLDELARIDLHDLRVRLASRLSNHRCELIEMQEELRKREFTDLILIEQLDTVADALQLLQHDMEPRRQLKKGTPNGQQ